MTCSYSKEFSASAFTDVENIFIYEYLPVSSGDAVKVYLYGLFLCQNQAFDCPIEKIAENLKMPLEKVIDCFAYWEDFGLVSIVSKTPFTVTYLPVRSAFSNKPRKYNAEKYTDFTKSIQALLPERMISVGEYQEYFSIMETYSIKPDAMVLIVKYCTDRKGRDIGYKYISKVAKDFGNRGIITVDKVEKELSSYILRTSEIEKILKALTLKRQPEIEDLNLLKKWTKELNFELDNILFAASNIKKGSMAKLDEFLLKLYSMKCFSKEEIDGYIKEQQHIYQLAVKINRALSIYMEVIDTVADTYTKKWISYGYSDEALLLIASICFKNGKNTLQDMDDLIEDLYHKGIIELTSVNDWFDGLKKTDEFISKMLLIAGINRRPVPSDRELVSSWKNMNFSEEMILEACAKANGKTSPLPYVNGILLNWKNNGIYSVEDIGNGSSLKEKSQAEYNLEYEHRRSTAILIAQKNYEKAMDLEGFAEVYSRLNSIEKDLAFAEINKNEQALASLEEEKKNLYIKAENMLSSINLTYSDLSPKYACSKCNDTGYVGTHRCDCFNKK